MGEEKLKQIMNVEKAKVLLCDYADSKLVSYSKDGKEHKFPMNSGIAGVVAIKGEFQNVANAVNHNFYNGLVDIDTHMPLVVFPIRVNNEIIGVFEVINAKGIQGLSSTGKA